MFKNFKYKTKSRPVRTTTSTTTFATSIRTTTSVFAAIGTTATTFATSIRTIFATFIKTKG